MVFNLNLKLVKRIASLFILLINFLPAGAAKKNNKRARINLSDYISVTRTEGDADIDLLVKESDLDLTTNQLNFALDARTLDDSESYPKQIKIKAYTSNEANGEALLALLNATILNKKQARKFTFSLDIPETFTSQNLLIDITNNEDEIVAKFEQALVKDDSVAQQLLEAADCDNSSFGDCQMDYILNSINYQAGIGKNLATTVTKETNGKYTVSLPLVKAKGVKILNKIIGGKSGGNDFDSTDLLTKISTADDFNFTKIRLKPQSNLTTNPANGLLEFDGDKLYITKKGSRGEIATAGSSIVNLLTLTPQVNPPNSAEDGYVYFDASGALCVRINDAWEKVVGDDGICQEGLSDNEPDAFNFTDRNAQPEQVVSSDTITITGFENGQITISGQGNPEYSIDGAAFTSQAGVIGNAQSLKIRLTSNPSADQTRAATVTIGGVSSTWTVTSLACPVNFVYIPGSSEKNPYGNDEVSAGWCAAKHEMSPANIGLWVRDGSDGWHYGNSNGSGKTVTSKGGADSYPITQVTHNEAANACANDLSSSDGEALAGGQLMTVYYWSTIAQAIVDDGINWSGNAPGSGNLSRGNGDGGSIAVGLSGGSASNPTAGVFYYVGPQGRTWRMGSGEADIYDFAGNVGEWFYGTHDTSSAGSNTIDGSTTAFEYDNPNGPFEVSLLPSERSTHDTSNNGVGRIGADNSKMRIGSGTSAAYYGGAWDDQVRQGVFASYWDDHNSSSYREDIIGFRCIFPLGQ